MDYHQFAKDYLHLLESDNHNSLIQLFTKNGVVSSPIYGTLPAGEFYKGLMGDTNASKLRLDGVFAEENSNRIIVLFDYDWTLKNGTNVVFKVSDVFEFDDQGKVEKLTIIYDTVLSRVLVKEL